MAPQTMPNFCLSCLATVNNRLNRRMKASEIVERRLNVVVFSVRHESVNRIMADLTLKQRVEHLHSECCELRIKLSEKEFVFGAEVSDLKNQIASHLRTIDDLNKTIQELNCELNDYVSVKTCLEEKHHPYENLTSLNEKCTKMYAAKSEQCDSGVKELAAKCCDESMEIESPRNRSSYATGAEVMVLDTSFKDVRTELEEHKAMLNIRNKEIETLKSEKEVYIRALEECKSRVVFLEEATKINNEEVIRLNSEKRVFEDLIKSLKDQMEKCNGTISEYKNCVANYQSKINDFGVKVSKLINEDGKSEYELKEQIKNELDKLQERKQLVQDKEGDIQKVISENYENKTSFEKCKTEITRLLGENERMETEVSQLKLDIKIVSPEVDSIRQSLLKQENEIETPRIRKENVAKELIRSNSEIEYFVGRSTRIQLCTSDENESPFCLSFKRPQPMQRTAVQSKRNRSLFPKNMNVMNTNPEIELNIMKAVQKADQDANLIGDFTKTYALPLIVNSKHQDLKAISSETLASVIKGEYNELILKYIIVDCRYPYEYEGGHIKGAKNIYTQEQILAEFFDEKIRNEHKLADISGKRNVVIFHCEFSSERGPSLYRYLRSKDRELNTYPNLYHPEVYLLNGGYKAFFESFKELCIPQQYLPMLSKDHKHHLRQFRKSKSWNCENKFATNTVNLNRQ